MHENYKYSSYLTENQETRWATVDEIRNAAAYVDLSSGQCPAGGLPLISDGTHVYVDGQDTHTMIFGATGSKKTRLFGMPTIDLLAAAGESFIATDPKGELYERTSGYVAAQGHRIIVLNFRDMTSGDTWNPLYLPYQLYHSGHKERATAMLNDFVSSVHAPFEQDYNNRFFNQMAKAYLMAALMFLVECGTAEQMTVGNLARLCSSDNIQWFQTLSKEMSPSTVAGINFRGVHNSGERTMNNIMASVYTMINDFNVNQEMMRMIATNSIALDRLGREKTAVYLIIPDEKTSAHFLATSFIKQAYEVQIAEAQKSPGRKLPVRVNFVLDEFCNMPKIADMPAMITAARSRNMRFYLIAQSLHQLKGKYGEEANTIKGNCDNWVFLTSKEQELLSEISSLCGQIRLPNGFSRSLISTSELQRLCKEKGEALILHGREYPFITEMADIDQYKAFSGQKSVPQKPLKLKEACVFDMVAFMRKYMEGEIPCPFSRNRYWKSPVTDEGRKEEDKLRQMLGLEQKWYIDRTRRRTASPLSSFFEE